MVAEVVAASPCARNGQSPDLGSTGSEQDASGLVEGCSRGHDIVDQHDVAGEETERLERPAGVLETPCSAQRALVERSGPTERCRVRQLPLGRKHGRQLRRVIESPATLSAASRRDVRDDVSPPPPRFGSTREQARKLASEATLSPILEQRHGSRKRMLEKARGHPTRERELAVPALGADEPAVGRPTDRARRIEVDARQVVPTPFAQDDAGEVASGAARGIHHLKKALGKTRKRCHVGHPFRLGTTARWL